MADSSGQHDQDIFPPISPEIYRKISNDAKQRLGTILTEVQAPIENANKTRFEHITIFAVRKKSHPLNDSLKSALKSLEWTKQTKFNVFEIKWAWPENKDAVSKSGEAAEGSTSFNAPKFSKVILHVWDSNDELTEFMTQKASGELSKLLGKIIHRKGLTYKKDTLFLRIPGLEKVRKSESSVSMITDRAKILSYLGLDASQDLKAFKTWTDLMDYAATCRFYDAKRLVSDADEAARQKVERKRSEAKKLEAKKKLEAMKLREVKKLLEAIKLPEAKMPDEKKLLNAKKSDEEKLLEAKKPHEKKPGDKKPAEKKLDSNNLRMFEYFTQVYLPAQAKFPALRTKADADLSREEVLKDAKQSNCVDSDFAESYKKTETAGLTAHRAAVTDKRLREALPKFVKGTELKSVIKGLMNGIYLTGPHLESSGFGPRNILKQLEWCPQSVMKQNYVQSDVNWVYAGALQRVLDAKKSSKHCKAYKMEQELKTRLRESLIDEAEKMGKHEDRQKREDSVKKMADTSKELGALELSRQKIKDATKKLKDNKQDWEQKKTLEEDVDKAVDHLLSYLNYLESAGPQPVQKDEFPPAA